MSRFRGYNLSYHYPTEIGLSGADFQRNSGAILSNAVANYIIFPIEPGFNPESMSVGNLFKYAHSLMQLGDRGVLPADKLERYQAWHRKYLGGERSIFRAFIWMVRTHGPRISEAFAAAGTGWRTNPDEAANVLLMQAGYGLSRAQWYDVGHDIFQWIAKELQRGTINPNYLAAAIEGLLHTEPAVRKMPIWHVPPAFQQHDPIARAAWTEYLNKSGWNRILGKWRSSALQNWAREHEAFENRMAVLDRATEVLSYASGKVILDHVNKKLEEFEKLRNQTRAKIKKFTELVQGPQGGAISPKTKAKMVKAEQDFIKTDNEAYQRLNKVGLWPENSQHGAAALSGLGWVQLAIGGAVAVTALGIIAYIVAMLTAIDRASAAAYDEATEQIQENIRRMVSSCERNRKEGTFTEDEYRACIEQANKQQQYLPATPQSQTGRLVTLGIAAAAAVGIYAYNKS